MKVISDSIEGSPFKWRPACMPIRVISIGRQAKGIFHEGLTPQSLTGT